MPATNQQVQSFVDTRIRPRCEQIRALYLACKDDKIAIEDIYQNVIAGNADWEDNRTDHPPHLATRQNVLAYNTFIAAVVCLIEGTLGQQNQPAAGDAAPQYPVVQALCVRAP